MDMNDRALRHITVGLGGKANGFPREDGFIISVASEVMAILCLAENLTDLKRRLGRIIIGYNMAGEPVTAGDLKVDGAMAVLLKDAIKPNLVQTLENTPCLMHGGPFANIAHGCNSLIATRTALKLGDYAITEAGFGADLGAEKFFDIKCRYGGLKPSAAVLVASVKALKYNGGVKKDQLASENLAALEAGIPNLKRHVDNIRKFGVPVIVAINRFPTDTPQEIELIREKCRSWGVESAVADVFARGGEGGLELARKLCDLIDREESDFKPVYDVNLPVKDKIERICTEIYGAGGVAYSSRALKDIKTIEEMGMGKLPICMAKTQFSLSDNPALLGAPSGFTITVNEVRLSAGAGFIVALTGDIMTMPGLPKDPAANHMDIDNEGRITGLF